MSADGFRQHSVLRSADMLISGREARAMLEAAGFSTRHARTALNSHLAGPPIRSAVVHLYDETLVRDLAERPVVDWLGLSRVCPDGFLVTRRDLDLSVAREELVAQVSRGWDGMSPWMRVAMSLRVARRGSLPLLATVAGVVVLGAEIVSARDHSGVRLGSPGAWFAGLQGARLSLGPGRPWVLQLS